MSFIIAKLSTSETTERLAIARLSTSGTTQTLVQNYILWASRGYEAIKRCVKFFKAKVLLQERVMEEGLARKVRKRTDESSRYLSIWYCGNWYRASLKK